MSSPGTPTSFHSPRMAVSRLTGNSKVNVIVYGCKSLSVSLVTDVKLVHGN